MPPSPVWLLLNLTGVMEIGACAAIAAILYTQPVNYRKRNHPRPAGRFLVGAEKK